MPPRRFAFLVHPLVPAAQRLVGLRGAVPAIGLGRADGTDPRAITPISTLSFQGVEGVVVGIPLLPEQLLADQGRALDRMERAAQLAAPIQMIGLGSVLAVIAGRGGPLSERTGLPVTTGQAATTWAALHLTRQIAGEGPIAVLGTRGAVGKCLLEMLRQEGRDAAGDPEDLSRYPVVVGAHTTGGVLSPDALGPNTQLIDVALPPTLSGSPRPDTRVWKGEAVALPPGWKRDAWGWLYHLIAGYGLRDAYACLLEPLVAVLEGRTTPYAQGRRVDPANVRAFGDAALRYGFVPALRPLQGGPR